MWKRATPLHRQEARVAPPSPAGQLDPAGSAADSSGVKRAAPAPDSTAAKGIASRSGVGKLKRLDIKELWLQEKVRAAQLRIRKVGTESELGRPRRQKLERSTRRRLTQHHATVQKGLGGGVFAVLPNRRE